MGWGGFMPKSPTGFSLAIEYHREEDGRWLADIPALPGVFHKSPRPRYDEATAEPACNRTPARFGKEYFGG